MKVLRILKWLAIGLVILMGAIQFIRPARSNPASDAAEDLAAHVQVNPHVAGLLQRSCADCHSNKTRWPWYSNVAPVSWFVIDHVNHGRSHLNFSEWGKLSHSEADEMLRDICKEVQSGAMPLTSYTRIHRKAAVSAEERRVICEWTNRERERLQMGSSRPVTN